MISLTLSLLRLKYLEAIANHVIGFNSFSVLT